MKLALTSIFVPDPVKAFKFYTEVLGFLEKQFIPEAQLAVIVSPEDPDGTAILLEPGDSPIAKNYKESLYNAGIPCIVFGTSDINKEYENLKSKGVKFRSAPQKTDYGILAQFEDSFGNIIQLHEAI